MSSGQSSLVIQALKKDFIIKKCSKVVAIFMDQLTVEKADITFSAQKFGHLCDMK